MIVIADTSPLSYLLLLEKIELLPRLYGRVVIPEAVHAELRSDKSPLTIKQWITNPPTWFEVRKVKVPDNVLTDLGVGEREAILLAEETKADLLLLDDWDARQEASKRHLIIAGTLRVLEDAASLNLINLPVVVAKLRSTNFRVSEAMLEKLLARDTQRRMKGKPTS